MPDKASVSPSLAPLAADASASVSSKKYVGPHVSAGGGVEKAVLNAHAIGARAFALYTRNQRQWYPKPLTQESISLFTSYLKEYGFSTKHILPHASYLINIGNADDEKRHKSREAFLDEIKRCELLGLEGINFHPGSHLNVIAPKKCLQLIAQEMNWLMEHTTSVKLILENTAGQGTNLGFQLEHLAEIIDQIEDKSRVGVCIDTAHTLAAGYEIRTPEGYASFWKSFDEIIGDHYLMGIHFNDSKKDLGTHVDRHASLGEGVMGEGFFSLIMNDPRLDDLPIILETPDENLWAQEIRYLYSLEQ